MGECKALSHLDLSGNGIEAEGAGRLAGALGECKALSHLDLSQNRIGATRNPHSRQGKESVLGIHKEE